MEGRTVIRRRVALGLATFVVPIVGQATSTTPPYAANLYAQDVAMPGCTPMSECALAPPPGYTGSMVNRGLCVLSGGKNACWDVCNPEHEPADYQVSSTGGTDPGNSLYNHISEGLVGAVRDGLNNNVSCPPALQKGFATDICTPGTECTNKMRHRFNIQRGRGLCVVDSSARGARICMDMCNLKMDPSRFAQGSPAGTHIKVVEFRASGACQDKPWLIWLLAILGIALLLCCCAAGYYTIRGRRGLRKGSDAAAMKELDEDMLPDSQGMENFGGDDYQQEPPQDQYGADPYAGHFDDGQNEYGANPPSMDQEPYQLQQQQAQRSMSRGVESFSQQQAGLPAASPSPGGSMRAIPGLTEPHLQIPQMQVGAPGASPQSGVPRLSSTGGVSPALGVTYTTAPAVPQGAFQTQLPQFTPAPAQPVAMYGGASPAVSYNFQPGAMAPSNVAPPRYY